MRMLSVDGVSGVVGRMSDDLWRRSLLRAWPAELGSWKGGGLETTRSREEAADDISLLVGLMGVVSF